MKHLALNVYQWQWDRQDGLLVHCLGPVMQELRSEGLVHRFWFYRFDARGPHVSVVLDVPETAETEVRARLGARLDGYLAARPCEGGLSLAELEQRHAECRGKQLCATDAEPGFAPNNSYRLAEHPSEKDPLWMAAITHGDDVRRLTFDLALWTIEQLRRGAGTAAAVRWIAAVDHALRRAAGPTDAYWRYHATTLLPRLGERLERDPARVFAALPALVGESNRRVFSRVWSEVEEGLPVWPHLDDLVALLLGDGAAPPSSWQRLVRSLDHSVLHQLRQPVRLHLPLVLFAWLRDGTPQPSPC